MELRVFNKEELTDEDITRILKYLNRLDYTCDLCSKRGNYTIRTDTMKLSANKERGVPYLPIVLVFHTCGKVIMFDLQHLEDAIFKQEEEDLIAF